MYFHRRKAIRELLVTSDVLTKQKKQGNESEVILHPLIETSLLLQLLCKTDHAPQLRF